MVGLILNRPKVHLIIPDSHSHADFSNIRYNYLGRLINDIRPDLVVDIGDWWDMPSLSSYDKGGKSYEGRRYHRDINAGLDAQERVYDITRQTKRRLPKFIRTLGNHEFRIERVIEKDPILEGTIGLGDLQSKEYGWEEYPFLVPANFDGITYQHYFVSGISGRPISGDRIGLSLVNKQLSSCTQGHSHLFDHYVRNRADGGAVHGLSCGVFQDYRAPWAGPSNDVWHRGIVIKRNVYEGHYDLQWVSMDALRREYGDK